jgi:hypothetical protein
MTTWTFKHLVALGLLAVLGACDTMTGGEGLLANLTPPEDAALPAVPLTQAMMMRGSLTLVPPNGYCIDAESLTQSFALMARCEALGATTQNADAPVGVMTVSLARSVLAPALPSAQELVTAANLGTPTDARQSEQSVVFQTTGTPPSSDLSDTHWRSVSKIGRITMGAALFGPTGQRAVSAAGADLLEEMISRTTAQTNAG